MNNEALIDLLFRVADDELIYAHRNSEWTGLAPTLEEDIAFSSIAQDKLGHAQALYTLLHQLGENEADQLAFSRQEHEMRSCHFVEVETMDYAFALVRHFMFDTAERLRFTMLESSSYTELAQLAVKIRGEIKYHTFHANTWMEQLGAKGNEESKARIQTAINECFPLALGLFEPSTYEDELRSEGIFGGEVELQTVWLEEIKKVVERSGLSLPAVQDVKPVYGGRKGFHSDQLAPLLDEMTEVFRLDPTAQW